MFLLWGNWTPIQAYNNLDESTLTLQKPRVLQMQGVPFDKLRGEAVVVYADSLAGRLPAGPNL
jgi:hypothetical protein